MSNTPYSSRHSRQSSPTRAGSTPASISRATAGHIRTNTLSPPPQSTTSYSPTATPAGPQRLNVVTRVAIEGKAKQDQDGASIKMYLKIAIPLESIHSGSTIALFPEENIKILTSQVHPLDSTTSAPYNFSSTVSPLLHNAARSLGLPARLNNTYLAAFGLPTGTRASSRSTSNAEPIPVDVRYTGHIIVTQYNISYVLPKEFPTCKVDGEGDSRGTPSPFRSRRASVGEKNVMQFMAAIDMWVPYVARPPRSPFSLTIPTPRCLQNNIKLRIYPPKSTSTSSSFASLSSADDESNTGSQWELTSEPHVTRSASKRLSRSSSYAQFADDESSDSSTAGFSEGCGIQGTFRSAERIKVRWAKPMMKAVGDLDGGDGRRRVGVRDVVGEMSCVVLGKKEDGGVMMNVDYKGTCTGVWFAGVATLLGLDVGLEAKGSDVSWVDGTESKWTVSGGNGYTGWDVGAPPTQLPGLRSRDSSIDSLGGGPPQILLSPSSPSLNGHNNARPSATSSRQNSTASLLRVPLPVPSANDISFEASSSSSSPSGSAMSSMASLTAASTNNNPPRLPGVPVTLHINISELAPAAKNTFTFTISGTIVVTPRPVTPRPRRRYSLTSRSTSPERATQGDNPDLDELESIVLPRFTVLAADSESTTIIVRNEVDSGNNATIEVYHPSGDIRDAKTRKTVLQRGGTTRCGEDGGRIAVRATSYGIPRHKNTPSSSSANNNANLSRVSSSSSLRQMLSTRTRPKRDGPLIIPFVTATVTPLILSNESKPKRLSFPNAYAVRICLPVPIDTDDDEWLEFGLAQPGGTSLCASIIVGGSEEKRMVDSSRPPRVEICCASVDGVPVRFETTATARPDDGASVPFDQLSGREWVSWIVVHVGSRSGTCVVDYVVSDREEVMNAEKAGELSSLNVFLPTFALPVGRLEVLVNSVAGLTISSLRANLMHQQLTPNGRKLLHFSADEYFYPQLAITTQVESPPLSHSKSLLSRVVRTIAWILPTVLATILLFWFISLGSELRGMRKTLDEAVVGCSERSNFIPSESVTVTATTTTTFIAPPSDPTGSTGWWFVDPATETTQTVDTMASPSQGAPALSPSPEPTTRNEPSDTIPLLTTLAWEPQASATPETSLLPYNPKLMWPWLKIEFDFKALKPPARIIGKTVVEKAKNVWFLLRTIYHYPLEPPP